MPTVINGLPAHILLIHVVVVLIPLGALFTVLSVFWPAARRKLGFISPLTCFIALVFVPITTNAGEWLDNKINPSRQNQQINKHVNLGHDLLPWALALFVFSALVWWLGRKVDAPEDEAADESAAGGGTAVATRTRTGLPTWVTYVVSVLAVAISVVAVIVLIRIGDSGATAAWSYVKQIK